MNRKEEIEQLGKELDAKWLEIEEYTEAALTGRYRVSALCLDIEEACELESRLRKAQFMRLAESKGINDDFVR